MLVELLIIPNLNCHYITGIKHNYFLPGASWAADLISMGPTKCLGAQSFSVDVKIKTFGQEFNKKPFI